MHMTREKFTVLEMFAESRTTGNKTLPLCTPQKQNMNMLPLFSKLVEATKLLQIYNLSFACCSELCGPVCDL
jgi:hypothetical protein